MKLSSENLKEVKPLATRICNGSYIYFQDCDLCKEEKICTTYFKVDLPDEELKSLDLWGRYDNRFCDACYLVMKIKLAH